MSLLIKALDKAQAQAQKAQAKDNISEPKKRTQSPDETNSKKGTAISEEKSEAAALSLSPLEKDLATNAKVEDKVREVGISVDSYVPAALRGSTADNVQKAAQLNITEKREPITSVKPVSQASANERVNPPTQAQAANVFAAKRLEPTHQTAKVALVVGLLALAIMAALAYWYQFVLNKPDIVILPRPVLTQEMPAPLPELSATNETPMLIEPEAVEQAAETVHMPALETQAPVAFAQKPEKPKSILMPAVEADVEETLAPNEMVVDTNVAIVRASPAQLDLGIASESASIEVTQKKKGSEVNPILMRAYEAYNAGNDRQAQADYKQVLQRFGTNVDAMLGLGAIAMRQGRMADANGWYRKVLEVEPRNEVAKAELLNTQQVSQPQASESSIKSMLASTPDDANLHAALGNLYAEHGQWAAAQQAYFDAYKFNPSAENAFNLGVSLDQLGKPKLALPHYQEALQKADQSNVIDAVALEARISSIE